MLGNIISPFSYLYLNLGMSLYPQVLYLRDVIHIKIIFMPNAVLYRYVNTYIILL